MPSGAATTDDDEIGTEPESSVPGQRMCAVTRLSRPLDELIRFVADPEGRVVPDLARRLPGRGVSITADRQSLAKAVKQNVFARGLKRPVTLPNDLGGLVEQLLHKRLLERLSLCAKAGLTVTGFSQVEAALEAGELKALLHGSDAAADGCGKLDRKWKAIAEANVREPIIFAGLTIAEISLALGRANVVHAGLKPGGATDRFLSEAFRLSRFRSGVDASVNP